MDTIAKIHVRAETIDVVVFASQARGLGQHVLNACFLGDRQYIVSCT